MRHLRRVLTIICMVAATATALAACGSSGKTSAATEPGGTEPGRAVTVGSEPSGGTSSKLTGTVRIMAEHEVLESAVLKPFEEENPGLNVETAEIEGSSEAATKLSAGFSTDVVETCADEITPLIKREMLAPIETSKLTHWEELYPSLRAAKGVTKNGQQMFVPLQAGPHGLVYNTSAFPNGVDSIKELFNPSLQGKVALQGDDHAMIAMAAFSLGIEEPFSMSSEQLETVGKYLVAHASQFRAFPKSDADQLNLMKSKEVVLMDAGLATAQEMQEGGVPVKWVPAKEGVYSWVCGLAVAKNAKNVPAAYALLNYYTSVPVQAKFGDEGYVVLNSNALPEVKPSKREIANPEAISGSVVEQAPPDGAKWNEIYQEVVAG